MGLIRFLVRQLRTPECPVSNNDRRWVERRMQWLLDQFGTAPLLRPTLTPTPEHFPPGFSGTDEEFEDLFCRLCTYMHIDHNSIELVLYSEERAPHFKGLPIYESQ